MRLLFTGIILFLIALATLIAMPQATVDSAQLPAHGIISAEPVAPVDSSAAGPVSMGAVPRIVAGGPNYGQ